MPDGQDFGGMDGISQFLQNQPVADPNERLRDAFAALLTQQGRPETQPITAQELFQSQFGKLDPNMAYTAPPEGVGQPGDIMAMPRMRPQDPTLGSSEFNIRTPSMAPLSEAPQLPPQGLGDPSKLFPGAKSISIMAPQKRGGAYALPGR